MRPIATSDSCNTLVDLNDDHHDHKLITDSHLPLTATIPVESEIVQTHLLLPTDDDLDYDSFDEDGYNAFLPQQPKKATQQYLFLPSSSSPTSVDKHLSAIPAVVENADMLLSNPPQILSQNTTDKRILNICQNEIGHATSSQCDVIVSDRATTCHIVAVRSTCSGAGSAPLASLTHIDREGHEQCLRNMIELHKAHHSSPNEEEKKEDDVNSDMIEMDLHIMGGFNDEDGSSRKISECLLDIFSRIASEEVSNIQMTLQTCAISTMNDNGLCCPIGRGLGMNIASGQVFLASVDESVAGPATTLRSARLWSGCNEQLTIVHTPTSDALIIPPFQYQAIENTDIICSLPDHIILQHTSTSPDVEDDDFCANVRATLQFMQDTACTETFGLNCDEAIVYKRDDCCGNNQWALVSE